MRIDGFDWDDGNWPKCGKHGVSKAEIEALFDDESALIGPDLAHSTTEQRFFAVGPSARADRALFVIFTLRSIGTETRLRPVSARYMHDKERRKYEKDTE